MKFFRKVRHVNLFFVFVVLAVGLTPRIFLLPGTVPVLISVVLLHTATILVLCHSSQLAGMAAGRIYCM